MSFAPKAKKREANEWQSNLFFASFCAAKECIQKQNTIFVSIFTQKLCVRNLFRLLFLKQKNIYYKIINYMVGPDSD